MRLCDILEGKKRTSFGGGLTSTSRCCLGILLLNGNPQKVPRMVPTRDWAPPSFPTHPSMTGNHHQPHSGTGTGEPQQRLRVDASFHQLRSPVWEGHGGVLAGRSGSGMERANAAGSSQLGEILGTGTASTGDQQVAGFEPGKRGLLITWVRAQLR